MTTQERESWAVRVGAEKILAAEDMHDYAIFALDAGGGISTWNRGAERMKGYRSEEVIGRHFSLFYPPEQQESGYPDWELQQAAADGFFIDRGWRVRKDGSRFWAHVVITAQRTEEGKLTGFIKVVRNESEAEARQQRSRRQFTDLFELATTGIALFDADGRFLDANGALCDLLGYRLSELRERTDSDVVHPLDGNGRLFPHPGAAEVQGVAEPLPHRVLRRADGSIVRCQLYTAATVRDDGSRSWLVFFHDVTEQISRAEQLRHEATHDPLTGLLDRRGLEQLLERLRSEGRGFAVLFCDLNNFKRVNDALGHEAGDELLAEVARRVGGGLPEHCTPARLYGDEFAIIAPDVAPADLDELTTRVAELFRMSVPLRDRHVHLSASIGATFADDPQVTVADLLRVAEAAMMQDRVRGQGQVNLLRGRARSTGTDTDQLTLEEQLRDAIDRDDLGVHYQPIVGNDGTVRLAEALLRWEHPDLGRLSADVVLDVAERGGLLADLDRCVLRTALRESAGWRRPDGGTVGVAVNLAGLRPEQHDFVEVVTEAIREAGTTPDRVVLEMVETVLAEMSPAPRHAMTRLSETGVRFAVDDFGTGYSSLARLRELPAEIVKLDRDFISGVGSDPADLGIVLAMSELVRTLGRFCIAEGVETSTQHHLLRAVGIDAYQGYLFTAPLPPEEFRAFLRG